MTTLAERLKLLVSLVEGLSFRELADLIEVSQAYPSLIASGHRPKISAEIASKIATVFGTTIDFVVTGAGEPPTADQAKAAVAAARELKAPPASQPNPTPGTEKAS